MQSENEDWVASRGKWFDRGTLKHWTWGRELGTGGAKIGESRSQAKVTARERQAR